MANPYISADHSKWREGLFMSPQRQYRTYPSHVSTFPAPSPWHRTATAGPYNSRSTWKTTHANGSGRRSSLFDRQGQREAAASLRPRPRRRVLGECTREYHSQRHAAPAVTAATGWRDAADALQDDVAGQAEAERRWAAALERRIQRDCARGLGGEVDEEDGEEEGGS